MAHKVYELEIGLKCPRCNNTQARLAIYHFGTSFTAECAGCAWGPVEGDNEAMAVARYRGKLLEAGALPPNENPSHQPPPNGGRLDGVVGIPNQEKTNEL